MLLFLLLLFARGKFSKKYLGHLSGFGFLAAWSAALSWLLLFVSEDLVLWLLCPVVCWNSVSMMSAKCFFCFFPLLLCFLLAGASCCFLLLVLSLASALPVFSSCVRVLLISFLCEHLKTTVKRDDFQVWGSGCFVRCCWPVLLLFSFHCLSVCLCYCCGCWTQLCSILFASVKGLPALSSVHAFGFRALAACANDCCCCCGCWCCRTVCCVALLVIMWCLLFSGLQITSQRIYIYILTYIYAEAWPGARKITRCCC